uniref:Programmed cell death 11 n=1 Tax=Echinostoma caproni TaxID=27848 RepID=A0A183AN07_9TREM
LIVDPGTKQLTGSLLPHLLPPNSPEYNASSSFDTLTIGTRFPSAVVDRVDKRTIHVRLDTKNGVQGVIRKVHIPDKLKSDNLKSKFSVGQKVNCRVIDHDLLENVAVGTMKKKLLRLPYLSINEISPGDKVNTEIVRFTKTGIVVRVEERLNGLVPFLHLADLPIKNPAQKFTRGQKLLCRVLTVDKTANKLILTAKRGLVESNCPLLGSKEMIDLVSESKFLQDSSDQLFSAFVAKVLENGMLLIGVNNMRAWLPRKECGLSSDDALDATFFHGQVLRIFDARVHKVQNTGIIVNLLIPEDPENANSNARTVGVGFLRFEHLTDHETNIPLLTDCLSSIKPGAPLSLNGRKPRQVVVINQTGKMALVSAKPTLLHAARESRPSESDENAVPATDDSTGFVRDFPDLQNHVDYGVFVQFPAGIRGLAPVRLLCDRRIPQKVTVTELFPTGATVIAKVVELAPSEKRRCLVSLRMIDTYTAAEEQYVNGAIQSLRNWLTEQEWISERQGALSAYRIGDLVSFRITDSDSLVAVGEACKQNTPSALSSSSSKKVTWVAAVVYRENADGVECQPGQLCTGVVTFVDFVASRLELVLSSWLINSINHRDDLNEACALRPGQKVSSVTVALRQRDVAVVAFRGHAAGRFGLVPARRTFNDVIGGNAWSLGQRNQVTLRL